MIIYGRTSITTKPDKGDFYCPTCNSKQRYVLKSVRNFFTLYFIPVIPLNKLGEYVECHSCRNAYKSGVLDYDPEKESLAIEAEYHSAIKKVMIYMLLADGVIDDSEIKMTQDVYQSVARKALPREDVLKEIGIVEKSPDDLSKYLFGLQGKLNNHGKEMVLRAALQVAFADGEFQKEEQQLIAKIGTDLGMTRAHINGVVSGA